jgi:hypothetical protein
VKIWRLVTWTEFGGEAMTEAVPVVTRDESEGYLRALQAIQVVMYSIRAVQVRMVVQTDDNK